MGADRGDPRSAYAGTRGRLCGGRAGGSNCVPTARAPCDARLDLTVVVPVYNNVASLALLCRELKAALDPLGISYELLFVNDGSTDASAARLAELAEQHPEITLVELSGNFGQQVAVLCGLERASGASCVVM